MLQDSAETESTTSPNNSCEPDDTDSPSSENEIEPVLKYERLANDVETILQKEAVSCVAFNSKIICIGTFWGLVHAFDHAGHRIPLAHIKAHTMAVNQISMDVTGDFIATCADDGKVYVYGLYYVDSQLHFTATHPIYSVAIDPHYSKSGANRRFITGGDRLLLHEKLYLVPAMRTTALQEGIGSVQNLKWHGRFVTYAYRDSVRVYDIEERKMVGLIQWDHPEDEPLEQHSCCLTWKNHATLLIGWSETFRICRVERRTPIVKESPTFMINVITTSRVNYLICGICPLDVSQLVILAYKKKRDASAEASAPRLHFFEAEGNKYVEVCSDTLSLRSYRQYTCVEYHLEHCYNENEFIIACPKDVVVAVRCNEDERIDWLVDHNNFEKALALATAKQERSQRNTVLEVGEKYISYLMSRQEFALAGQICAQVLGDDKELWEKVAFKFDKEVRAISQCLPADPQNQLRPREKAERAIGEPVESPAKVKAAAEELVFWSDVEQVPQKSSMVTHSKPYEEALDFYIAVKYKGVFEYAKEKKLKKKLYGRLNALLELDPQQAVKLLVDQRLNVDKVVSELQTNRYYQYLYLDAMNINYKHEARKYHNLLVKLYAEFCQTKLLPLLRRSRYYSLPKALSVCEEHNLYREVVHLLSRTGGTRKALHVLLHKVDDVEMATLFCEKHNDPELWQDLLEHYKANPEFLEYSLPRIDKYLDARTLIRRIDDKVLLGDLKKCLISKLGECRQKSTMEEGCKNIMVRELNYTFKGFVSSQNDGHRVDYDLICNVCNQKVLVEGSHDGIAVFLCSHTFHEKCLSSTGNLKKCFACLESHSKTSLKGNVNSKL